MRRIGDRMFLFAWQTIRAATQPDPEAVTWQVGEVSWSRHRYSHTTPKHSLTVEVHQLDCEEGKDTWSIMVVVEHWWDVTHKPLRNHVWASHVSGSRLGALEWMERCERTLEQGRRCHV